MHILLISCNYLGSYILVKQYIIIYNFEYYHIALKADERTILIVGVRIYRYSIKISIAWYSSST